MTEKREAYHVSRSDPARFTLEQFTQAMELADISTLTQCRVLALLARVVEAPTCPQCDAPMRLAPDAGGRNWHCDRCDIGAD